MRFIEEQMKREDKRVAIVQYKYFFDHVNLETTLHDFSNKVLEVCGDERLSLQDKQTVLTDSLRKHVELLSLEVLEKYIKEIHKDPVLLSMLFKHFSTLPIPCGPDLEIVLKDNCTEIWTIRKMLCALRIISPEEIAFFATSTKSRFGDSLPGWVWMKLTGCESAEDRLEVSDEPPQLEKEVIVFVDCPRSQNGRTSRNFGKTVLAKQNENPGCLVASR